MSGEEVIEHRSPLHDWHVAQGGEFLWEDDWPWMMDEGRDTREEYEAVRSGVGIWDLHSTAKYEITGPDAARLIQRRFTNRLEGMTDGGVRYGALVNADGTMIDDGNVYRFAADRYWLFINTPGIEDWFLETAEGLDASIAHRTRDLWMVAVQGPGAHDLLQGLTDGDLTELRYFHFWPGSTKVAGAEAWVLRTGFSGEKGYEVVTDPANATAIWRALLDAGAVPFGLNAIDLARTEVGLIIIAVDYDPGNRSPWDLSMDRFIATDTECVAASALAERGADPPKRFKSLSIDGATAPDYGAAVTKDGHEVGVVTSPAVSPRVGAIALAILDASVAEDGTVLDVAMTEGTAAATVGPLSILDPTKERPRA
jgi:aminomethyltransferase